MMYVTIEHNIYDNKRYIRFYSEIECITMELFDLHLFIPFPGGRISDDALSDLIKFLEENK